jgi:GTP-binding protein
MSFYPNVHFVTSANAAGQFPVDDGAEVAVAGRSNAGKSSAINAITQRKGLARTSKTPGATRLVNFFELEPNRRLVDLPGYGFAAVSGDMRRHWGALIGSFFGKRQALRGTVVVMDVRHPLTEHDNDMLALAHGRKLPVHILLTKSDKLGRNAARQTLARVRRELATLDGVTAQLFSALTGEGVVEARAAIERLLSGQPVEPTQGPAPTPQKEAPAGP